MEQRPLGLRDLVTLGSVMVGCLVGGCAVGLLLDAHFGTLPVLTLVGLGVGIASGALITFQRIRHFLS